MIRKFGTVDAPVDAVQRTFSEIEAWPQWMPGVRAVRVLERSETRALAEIERIHRRTRKSTFEFLFSANGQRERQVTGLAKKWESDWRFQPDQRQISTLVSCRLELDLGFIGLFTSSKIIQRWIDKTFEETLRGIGAQIRSPGSKSSIGGSPRPVLRTSRMRVFASPTELEIWLGDRKYVARADD